MKDYMTTLEESNKEDKKRKLNRDYKNKGKTIRNFVTFGVIALFISGFFFLISFISNSYPIFEEYLYINQYEQALIHYQTMITIIRIFRIIGGLFLILGIALLVFSQKEKIKYHLSDLDKSIGGMEKDVSSSFDKMKNTFTKNCPSCGKIVKSADNFCSYCGKNVR